MTGRRFFHMRIWIALLLACFVIGLTTVRSDAHARLERSDPISGSALQTLPATVHLTFTEPVDPASMRITLFDPLGATVHTGLTVSSTDHRNAAIDVLRTADALPGTYTLAWAVTSETDGHDSSGSIAFTVGTGRAPLVASDSEASRSPWWQIVLRSIWLIALGTLAAVIITPTLLDSRRTVLAPAVSGFVAAMIGVGSLANPVTADWLQMVAGVLTLFAGLTLWQKASGSLAVRLSVVTWLAAVVLLAASGHAAGNERPLLATIFVCVHMVLTLSWFGILVGFTAVAWRSREVQDLSRIARVAAIGLAIVLVSGLVSAALELPDRQSTTSSDYGLTLLIKVLIVILVLAIAATNRWVVPRWQTESGTRDDAQTRWLMLSESCLLLVLIAFGAILSNTSPPARFGTVQVAAPITLIDEQEVVSGIEIGLNATIAGTVDDRFRIALTPVPGSLQRVIIETSMTTSNGTIIGERFDADIESADGSTYSFPASRLSLTGSWTVQVIIRSAGAVDMVAPFSLDTSGWIVPAPRTVERSWTWPIVPLAGWGLVALALTVSIGGITILRRQQRVAPLSGAIIILALAMITTGFVIQAIQRSPPRTSGHDLVAPLDTSLIGAEADYLALCMACHGPDGAGLDTIDPNHQHGSGTNLLDERSRTLSDGDVYTLISTGVVGTDMPAYDLALSDLQRWNLVQYLRSLQDGRTSPQVGTPDAGDAMRPNSRRKQ